MYKLHITIINYDLYGFDDTDKHNNNTNNNHHNTIILLTKKFKY